MLQVNKHKEDKIIVVLIIIFLIVLGIYLIYNLLNVKEDNNSSDSNNNEYDLVFKSDNYKCYQVYATNDMFIVELDNNIINYNNNNLIINGVDVKSNIYILTEYVSFYGDNITFIIKDLDTQTDAILMFNKVNNTTTVIDKIDGMNVVYDNNTDVFEAGISITISNLNGKVLKINNKLYDLCRYKKNEVVYKELVYFYNYSTNSFYDMDIILTKTVKELQKDYCK